MAGGGAGGRELDQTPTWAVAAVCAVIVLISIILEKGLHHIGHWFAEKKKVPMVEALEKVKAELMILGFISLLLTFGQNYIAKICIPEKVADSMLPCSLEHTDNPKEAEGQHRRLLWDEFHWDSYSKRRFLAAPTGATCSDGKVPLVSTNGIHQLHIFIFFLAVFHLIASAITMGLGRAKIRRWKEWEKETETVDFEFSNDPSRIRFAHETSFVRQHTSILNKIPLLFYVTSFFRQFFRSVRKADYLSMRHGFISAHLNPGIKFNFQKYIKRSLEDDFKVVVGISPTLWASAIIMLLLNVKGWQAMFWTSLLPLFILLAVGTKLQAIITKMALEIKERHTVIQGVPLVSLGDRHFWFERPSFVLFLIHFTLFQNAFQIIYFIWIWYSFGLRSCFHERLDFLIARLVLGLGVQFLCSYVTLPLYALVSQLGSHMKRSIFDAQTSQALKRWHLGAKKKQGKSSTHSPSRTPDASAGGSPTHPLHRFKTFGHSTSPVDSAPRYHSDHEMSDNEVEMAPPRAAGPNNDRSDLETGRGPGIRQQHLQQQEQEDFSFGRAPATSGPNLL